MKKMILAAIVAAPLAAFGQSTTPTTTSGTATFGGSQGDISTITVEDNTANFTGLDSETSLNAGITIAEGDQFNNVQAGYTVTFESNNNFTMVNAASGGESFVPYGLVYSDTNADTTMGAGGATAEECTTIPAALGLTELLHNDITSEQNGTPQGVAASTSVSYGTQNCGYTRGYRLDAKLEFQNLDFELLSGSYEDTVTVSIAANEDAE